jgi:hypothetical protein
MAVLRILQRTCLPGRSTSALCMPKPGIKVERESVRKFSLHAPLIVKCYLQASRRRNDCQETIPIREITLYVEALALHTVLLFLTSHFNYPPCIPSPACSPWATPQRIPRSQARGGGGG